MIYCDRETNVVTDLGLSSFCAPLTTEHTHIYIGWQPQQFSLKQSSSQTAKGSKVEGERMKYLSFLVAGAIVGVAISVDTKGATSSDNLEIDASYLTTFKHFIAHNNTQTCTTDDHSRPFNNQIRGVNLGT